MLGLQPQNNTVAFTCVNTYSSKLLFRTLPPIYHYLEGLFKVNHVRWSRKIYFYLFLHIKYTYSAQSNLIVCFVTLLWMLVHNRFPMYIPYCNVIVLECAIDVKFFKPFNNEICCLYVYLILVLLRRRSYLLWTCTIPTSSKIMYTILNSIW